MRCFSSGAPEKDADQAAVEQEEARRKSLEAEAAVQAVAQETEAKEQQAEAKEEEALSKNKDAEEAADAAKVDDAAKVADATAQAEKAAEEEKKISALERKAGNRITKEDARRYLEKHKWDVEAALKDWKVISPFRAEAERESVAVQGLSDAYIERRMDKAGGCASRALKDHQAVGWASQPPVSWRQPAEWVDLEFERAGLDDGGLPSRWGTEDCPHPPSGVLWPHAMLHEHRSRPFGAPETAEGKEAAAKNRDRLQELWRISSSHGISWDELDEAYVAFARAGTQAKEDWSRRPGAHSKKESGSDKDNPPPAWTKDLPLAGKMKLEAMGKAKRMLGKFTKDEDPLELFPTRTKRLAGRIFFREKKRYLGPWRPGKLSFHLQQLVAAKMLRRETAERAYSLPRSRP